MSTQNAQIFTALGPAQSRAARAYLGWTLEQAAQAAGVGAQAISLWESGAREPRRSTVDRLRAAYEAAGVEIGSDYVRLRGGI